MDIDGIYKELIPKANSAVGKSPLSIAVKARMIEESLHVDQVSEAIASLEKACLEAASIINKAIEDNPMAKMCCPTKALIWPNITHAAMLSALADQLGPDKKEKEEEEKGSHE